MKYFRGLVLVCLLLLSCRAASAQTVKALGALESFGSSGTGRIDPPSSDPLLDSLSNQRGMAIDPVTGHMVLVDSHSGGGGSSTLMGSIFVIDGLNGTNLATLNTTGIGGGNYADSSVAIADDGAVYVCNQVNVSGTLPFIIYRWDSVTSVDPPTIAFSNNITPTQRYGATIDARGSGPNTQIIIGSMPNSTSGTNVVIFTTTDGLNFTSHVLACPDIAGANFQDGIAFGPGDTFWAKRIGAPLRWMSFNLVTNVATTIASYDTTSFAGIARIGPIAVDTASNLLAGIEINTSGTERVILFDISNTNQPPALLDIEDYTQLNGNTIAPPGFLDFHDGRLYAQVINNGLAAFEIESVTPTVPTIIVQPNPTNRVVIGQSLTLSVSAYPATSYQWKKGGFDVPNATNAVFTISPAQTNDSGTYHVEISNSAGSVDSANAEVQVVNLADLYHLNLLWAAVPGDSSKPYVSSNGGAGTPNERSLAYNSQSNQLYVVHRNGSGTAVGTYIIYVLNPTNGEVLYTLNTNGVAHDGRVASGNSYLALNAIGVADDGAIYISTLSPDSCSCNATSTNSQFRLYRWENSHSNTAPVQIFMGDPASQSSAFRWGDIMHVRGSGTNTQIILDNQNSTARYISIITPTDDTMTNWVNKYHFLANNAGGTIIGRSLEFGVDNTFYQKRKANPLVKSSFDPESFPGITTTEATYSFSTNVGGLGLNLIRNAAVGINFTNVTTAPDKLDLYDVSDLNSPLLIAQYSFPNNRVANNNFIGHALFAGDRVFALDGNNGIMAFELVPGPPAPPSFVSQPQNMRLIQGGSGTLSVTVDQTSYFQWQRNATNIPNATNASYTISNAQTNDGGSFRVIATNVFGASTSSVAVVTVTPPDDLYQLSLIWSNNTLAVGTSGSPFQRSIAYNSLSNQLYLIDRATGLNVKVLDPGTGATLYELNTSTITPAAVENILLVAMRVADDGAIYAGNVSLANSTTEIASFRLYRWENSDPNTIPALVYEGEPANTSTALRWGDTMAIRGSGMNTEIVIDQQRVAQSVAAILTPVGSTATFTNTPFTHSYGGLKIGRSLQFGETNTVWQKNHGDRLQLSRFDLGTGTSVVLTNYNNFPTTLGGLAVDLSRNIAIGVDFTGVANTSPDTLNLYEISDLTTPMLVAKYNFPTNKQANGNFISDVIISANRVFALDANNGLLAFNLAGPAQPAITVTKSGGNITLTWADSSYTLQGTPSLTTPVIWTNISTPGQTTVTESASAAAKFYRLIK